MNAELRCFICNYVWEQKFPHKVPVQCPRCKRYDWNVRRELNAKEVIKL